MPILVDAHEDLAWNMLTFGRDPTVSVTETRRREAPTSIAEWNKGECLLGWPEYQAGQVAVVFATLFAAPARAKEGDWDVLTYRDASQARRIYRDSLDAYQRLADRAPDKFRLVGSRSDLQAVLDAWQKPLPPAEETEPGQPPRLAGHPVGLVILMEGAEAIREPDEVEEWRQGGVRFIGPAWRGNLYTGGTREPSPLTAAGRALLAAMAANGLGLDISHMDPPAAFQAVEFYEGTVVASHANPEALLKGRDLNRFLPDRLIDALLERDGVIGITPYNVFLDPAWSLSRPDAKQLVGIEVVANHIDYVCQRAGDARHAAIGSDFDGGFGAACTPAEIDSIADLQLLDARLAARGYAPADIAAIFGGNWLRILERTLP
jgi:membrane dipeptidase